MYKLIINISNILLLSTHRKILKYKPRINVNFLNLPLSWTMKLGILSWIMFFKLEFNASNWQQIYSLTLRILVTSKKYPAGVDERQLLSWPSFSRKELRSTLMSLNSLKKVTEKIVTTVNLCLNLWDIER